MTDAHHPAPVVIGPLILNEVRWHWVLLVAVCALLFLVGAGSIPLTDPEEARCALIVREMLRSGDWLMPHLNGQPYFDKPAPFFWLAAIGQTLTGNVAFGGRLAPASAGLLAILTTYAVARRMFSPRVGLLAGLVLATSVEFWYIARWYRMDMPFAAAMWAAIACFWFGERPEAGTAIPRWGGWTGFYLFCGIATLFKGPAGLGLPVLIVASFFALTRQWRRFLEFFHAPGIAVFVLVAAPWYVAVALREPAYVKEFLFEHNLMRFASTKFGHSWPGIIFVPVLLAGMLPWTTYVPAVVARAARARIWRGHERHETLVWLALLVPLIFFSFSGTKIVAYILPCLPPLAVLIAVVIAGWVGGDERRSLGLAAYVQIIVVALLWVSIACVGVELSGVGGWLIVPVIGCLGAGAMVRLVGRRRNAYVCCMIVCVAALLAFVGLSPQRSGYERLSTRALTALVSDADRANQTFVMWPRGRLSFRYYLDVQDPDRMRELGDREIDRLAAWMKGSRGVYALIVGADNLRRLEALCPEYLSIVGRNGDMWLVANRAVLSSRIAGTGGPQAAHRQEGSKQE